MITSLIVDNFKALDEVTITFSPFTVLIGDNSAGKTSVLQALAFLKCCCTSSMDKFLDERHMTVADITSKFLTKKNIIFSTKFQLDGKDIRWDLTIAKGKDRLSLSAERIFVNEALILSYGGHSNSYRLNERTGEKEPIMVGSYNNSIIAFTDMEKQTDIYPTLVSLKRFFSHMEALDLLAPGYMRGSSQGTSEMLGLSGEKLSSFIKSLSPPKREQLAQDVQKFLAPFSAVVPKTKQYGWVHLETQETYKGKTIDIPSVNISDGLLRIIAFCSLRFLNNEGGAILLDEIEDGINNEHLELLVDILRQIQAEKGVQIIATTHSTLLLDYWVNKQDIDVDTYPDEAPKSSIVFLYRNSIGQVASQDIFASPRIREMLDYMFPGEIVLNMTNREIREALSGSDTQ